MMLMQFLWRTHGDYCLCRDRICLLTSVDEMGSDRRLTGVMSWLFSVYESHFIDDCKGCIALSLIFDSKFAFSSIIDD